MRFKITMDSRNPLASKVTNAKTGEDIEGVNAIFITQKAGGIPIAFLKLNSFDADVITNMSDVMYEELKKNAL